MGTGQTLVLQQTWWQRRREVRRGVKRGGAVGESGQRDKRKMSLQQAKRKMTAR